MKYPCDSPRGTIEKIDYTYYENVKKLILAYTAEIANKEIDVHVRFVTPIQGCFYIFNYKLLNLPGFHLQNTKIRGMPYLFGACNASINITTKEKII